MAKELRMTAAAAFVWQRGAVTLAIAVALGLLCASCSSCHSTVGGQVPVFATLSNNADGTCSQSSGAVTSVNEGQGVRWNTASAVPFEIHFSASQSPFPASDFNSNGEPVTSPPVQGRGGVTYYYASLTINGHVCNLAGKQLGLAVK